MTQDTSSEDELVKKVAWGIAYGIYLYDANGDPLPKVERAAFADIDWDKYVFEAKDAISTARPIIAQQAKAEVLRSIASMMEREIYKGVLDDIRFDHFCAEHGITLEEK